MERSEGGDGPVPDVVPAQITLRIGDHVSLAVPVGAYVRQGERVRFVATVDVVGLAAVVFGIGTGLKLGSMAIRAAEAWLTSAKSP